MPSGEVEKIAPDPPSWGHQHDSPCLVRSRRLPVRGGLHCDVQVNEEDDVYDDLDTRASHNEIPCF